MIDPDTVFRSVRIVLLVLLGTVFLRLAVGKPLGRSPRALVLAILCAAVLSYPNFGFFHGGWGHIHYWDAYHYFMGPKYLPELGYLRLYDATYVAGRELGGFEAVTEVRDLTTYWHRPVHTIDAAAIRARFSPDRWNTFKRDLAFFSARLPWPGPLLDHGYNDPPPRALLLHVLLRWTPATFLTLTLLTSLDYLIIVAAYVVARRAFGELPAALAFAFLLLSFFARFDVIGGSLLRWDWMAALIVAVAALIRGRGAAAGGWFAYAVAARLFPLLFLVPLAIRWLYGRLTGSRDATVGRCLSAAAAILLVMTAAILATHETRTLLVEYVSRIRLHDAVPSINRVGLGTLLATHIAPWGERADGVLYVLQRSLMAARPPSWVLWSVAGVYLVIAFPLIRRARPVESLMYAMPLIFCALSPSAYYYSFLVLLVLLPWADGSTDNVRLLGMAVLTLNAAVSYAFELMADGWLSLFYQVSIQMVVWHVLWLTFEYVRLGVAPERLTRVDASLTTPGSRI
jgi:hypothetical protein